MSARNGVVRVWRVQPLARSRATCAPGATAAHMAPYAAIPVMKYSANVMPSGWAWRFPGVTA